MSKHTTQDPLFVPEQTEETAQLREDLKHVHAELTRLNDRYMILLKDRSAWERSVRAAAGRAAWEKVTYRYRFYLVAKVKAELGALCGRIEMLPDLPKPDQIERLKWAATDMRKVLSEHDNDTSDLVEEISRLRGAVQKQASDLHKRFGYEGNRSVLSESGRCECPGCELVRSIDDATPPGGGGEEEA
jgi:predicted nuclease with TOPRIM domain